MSENPFEAPQHVGTAPGPGFPTKAPPSVGLAVTSMVLGIVAIPIGCCCWLLGVPLALAAIVIGYLALNKVKDGTGGGRGMALAGLICGIAAIVLGIASIILGLVLNMPDIMDRMKQI